MSSKGYPIQAALADKLAARLGCVVKQEVDNKKTEVEELLKERALEWKDVAYIGESAARFLISAEHLKLCSSRPYYKIKHLNELTV